MEANPNGVLLDTHVLHFLDSAPSEVPPKTLTLLQSPSTRVFVSSLSAWEMSIKHEMGRWPEVAELLADYHQTIVAYGFTELPLQSNAALFAGTLPLIHKDPFDRGLIAQAVIHKLTFVSADEFVGAYVGKVKGLSVEW